jgi:hypothetical protein
VLTSPKSASEVTGDYQEFGNDYTLDVQTIKTALFGTSNWHICTSKQVFFVALMIDLCCSITAFFALI